jgi:hypothetical protein
MGSLEMWATRSGEKNILLLVLDSFNHVKPREEAPFAGEFNPMCG